MSTTHDGGADEIPRDPSAYRPSLHFKGRFEEPERHLDGEVIDTCIEEGEIVVEKSGDVRYRATLGGVTFRLIADPSDGRVITAYPLAINTKAARESGRWSEADVEQIREFVSGFDADR